MSYHHPYIVRNMLYSGLFPRELVIKIPVTNHHIFYKNVLIFTEFYGLFIKYNY
jgi:hypothetical protein